jgi:hypothetical protein
MDSLWREFQSDNLRVRLERSFVTTDSSQALPPPLDLWGWNMIGLVRSSFPIITNIKLVHLFLLRIALIFRASGV